MTDKVRIWGLYPNGDLTEQTHVLGPHDTPDGHMPGYDGDIEAWSDHNKEWRWGRAQIVKHPGEEPEFIYYGSVSESVRNEALNKIMGTLG